MFTRPALTCMFIVIGSSLAAAATTSDPATLANGKAMSSVFKAQATAKPLKALMAGSFAEARDMALNGPSENFVTKGGIVRGFACEPHNCGDHSITVAFDHEGHVWARLVRDGKTQYFGQPDPTVRSLMD